MNRATRAHHGINLRRRLLLLSTGLGLCALALLARAAQLQLFDNEFYQRQAQARYLRELPIATTRGMITDRNGEPLAVSTPMLSLWVSPRQLLHEADQPPRKNGVDPAQYISTLAQALSLPVNELRARLQNNATREFMYLRRRMVPEHAQHILDLRIPGVFAEPEYRRYYPQGEATAHVLGFTNIDDQGQEGLELVFDHWLQGKAGARRVIRDGRGALIENVELLRAAEPGQSLTLSIDHRLQYLALRELRQAVSDHQASGGSVVVMDVHTGEVLAMVNLPTYNPNAIGSSSGDARRNRAVTDRLDPGSTMKPLTVAIGLDTGVITPQTQIDTSPGCVRRGGFPICDEPRRNNGVLDITRIITISSNIGALKIAERVPDEELYEHIVRFGYNQVPGSGFPGEVSGVVPQPDRWYASGKATLGYGYGLSVTPLHIARAYSMLGNGGRLVQPTFVKGYRAPAEQVLPPHIAAEVVKMMQTTVLGGTARQAAITGYHVAGKTGTAIRLKPGGGYEQGHYNSFFAGIVPATAPRFAVVVVVNDPRTGGYYGGAVAAPVFRRLMEDALRLLDVPPDNTQAWLASGAMNTRSIRGRQ